MKFTLPIIATLAAVAVAAPAVPADALVARANCGGWYTNGGAERRGVACPPLEAEERSVEKRGNCGPWSKKINGREVPCPPLEAEERSVEKRGNCGPWSKKINGREVPCPPLEAEQ